MRGNRECDDLVMNDSIALLSHGEQDELRFASLFEWFVRCATTLTVCAQNAPLEMERLNL